MYASMSAVWEISNHCVPLTRLACIWTDDCTVFFSKMSNSLLTETAVTAENLGREWSRLWEDISFYSRLIRRCTSLQRRIRLRFSCCSRRPLSFALKSSQLCYYSMRWIGHIFIYDVANLCDRIGILSHVAYDVTTWYQSFWTYGVGVIQK